MQISHSPLLQCILLSRHLVLDWKHNLFPIQSGHKYKIERIRGWINRGKEIFFLCCVVCWLTRKISPALIAKVKVHFLLCLLTWWWTSIPPHNTLASQRKQKLTCSVQCDTLLSVIRGLHLICPWDTVTVNLLLVFQFPCHIDSWSEALIQRPSTELSITDVDS